MAILERIMKTPLLFDIPESLSPELKQIRAWRAQGVITFRSSLDTDRYEPWMAMNTAKVALDMPLAQRLKLTMGEIIAEHGDTHVKWGVTEFEAMRNALL